MPPKKRLGKKHRQAATRPKKGRAPRATPTTGAIAPKKRKTIAARRAELEKKRRIPTRSPENEAHRPLPGPAPKKPSTAVRPGGHANNLNLPEPNADAADLHAWERAETLAAHMHTAAAPAEPSAVLPLIAICGRPNVGKSTLFNRLTGSRRSIVGDEPGITRDRIYGQIDWANREARLVDTGGVVPDDPDLIPTEIFRQAQTALTEAEAIIMVVDGRTELASPDVDLARLLIRSGKPTFLAVNKIDTVALSPSAENFRRLGFANVIPISAEHGSGIGDLLDAVFAAVPEAPAVEAPEAFLTPEGELDEDATGPDFTEPAGSQLTGSEEHDENDPDRPRKLRSHASFTPDETRIAIIGRPNVGKSTLLNALTGSERAIVSPVAGTTRDAVDEVVIHDRHAFRFIDTAGIRRKGKTRLLAEKLSVIMARKHLEAADVSLLIIDATEGVHALDANIGGYAHESGRSVVIVVNKWDLMTTAADPSKPKADKRIYEEQLRDKLKFLDYAPLIFLSAAAKQGIDGLFKKIELVARERRKRVTTGQMNRFLSRVDFQQASVPMKRRVKIYYMTQAAVAPPTFVLFTDRDVKLHFSFERFLANQIRATFGFIGTPIWFKTRPRNKKQAEA
ncbi:MAG TPA: ribosome biogenesis GTPase Der [Acidobacteriaceae bacterium]|jgi:GTP-binding protein|nr:ribosome biogenesis GTPase Der [Acidobacteriaceae bacterium]